MRINAYRRQHQRYNELLCELRGYDLNRIERNERERIDWAYRELTARRRLAGTTASEHLTAILADEMLTRKEPMAGADPAVASLWLWHGQPPASVKTAQTVTRHFPELTIVARARNRRHEYHLMDLGIKHIFRETLFSSLAMSEQVLTDLGVEDHEVKRLIEIFRDKDEQLIREQHAVQHDEEQLIQTALDTGRELELLMRNDLKK